MCAFLIGCSATKYDPYQQWMFEPMPEYIENGDPWVIVILDKKGELSRRITMRFTHEEAKSCTSGVWNKIEVINEFPERAAEYIGKPAFSLGGAAITIDLTANLCDNSHLLRGHVQEVGISGKYFTSHLLGGEDKGVFYAVPAAPNKASNPTP